MTTSNSYDNGDDDRAALQFELGRLRAENARLLRLLSLSPAQATPPGPAQTAMFERAPGLVDASSSAESKIAFFRTLFQAREDVYAVRWENRRDGRGGWIFRLYAEGD